jgi:predicted ATPase/class 3 adenylate cyclase
MDNAREGELTPTGTAEQSRRVRRLVSVVFADIAGSTALAERLDSESLHDVLARYSDTCTEILERHGGMVEKYIGDAVVGVFGLPHMHEDDALRAVRAAVELRSRTTDLSTEFHAHWGIGINVKVAINSGEVFAGSGTRREMFATGDTFNVAARLEESAAPGEIVLGEQTYRLVQSVVRAEPLEPLAVKGRTAKVRLWRLLDVSMARAAFLRSPPAPFIGRKGELAQIQHALVQATAQRSCRALTIVGPPGIGKSRLARELIVSAGDNATVIVGRCVSYGEGITYLPLGEVVRELGADPAQRIGGLLAGDRRAELIKRLVLGAAGLGEASGRTEEIAWAFRLLFEALSRERPLLAVFDDVHWAQPALLDLLESLVRFSSGAPILLLLLARPELLEKRPAWALPQENRTLLALEPLPETAGRELVDHLGSKHLTEQVRQRITETAEGNPLFLEQLVAVQAEGSQTSLPPSIQAVLAARIDSLDPAERMLVEYASVEGRSFHRGTLVRLLPAADRTDVDLRLSMLMSKQLIRPDPADREGTDAFRFAHVLIREAAYESLPKKLRAQLHQRLASWLEEVPDARDEIVGYHYEQGHRCLAELGPVDERAHWIASRGADRLASAGRRAFARGDMAAAANLLGRALALDPGRRTERLRLLPTLGKALREVGQLARADAVLTEAVELAEAATNRRVELLARIERASLRDYTDSSSSLDELRRIAEHSIGEFESLGDDEGLAQASSLLAEVHWTRGHFASMEKVLERALVHAQRASDQREHAFLLAALARAAFLGPMPVEAALRRCKEITAQLADDRTLATAVLLPTSGLHALRGDFKEARSLYRRAQDSFEEFGLRGALASVPLYSGPVELLAGDPRAAERELRRGYDALEEMGDRSRLSTVAAFLAQALYAQSRFEEADAVALLAASTAMTHDAYTQALWRGTRAQLLAVAGDLEQAERLAREAVALTDETDSPNLAGDAHLILAEVLYLSGHTTRAVHHAHEAFRRYRAKGNRVSNRRAKELSPLDCGIGQA